MIMWKMRFFIADLYFEICAKDKKKQKLRIENEWKNQISSGFVIKVSRDCMPVYKKGVVPTFRTTPFAKNDEYRFMVYFVFIYFYIKLIWNRFERYRHLGKFKWRLSFHDSIVMSGNAGMYFEVIIFSRTVFWSYFLIQRAHLLEIIKR